MSPSIEVISDGKKFMWDGQVYDNKEEASRAGQSYEEENFQTRMMEQDGKFLVYTRRIVSQVAVPAQ
jgi:hypothetical protein